LAKFDRFVVGH